VVAAPCGSADFNCDGDVATDADIEAFFRCLAGACPPPPCASPADFNGDGDVATDPDIEAFFRVPAGGARRGDPAPPLHPTAHTTFTAAATATTPLTYQWRRNGVTLQDGPTGTGSTITGATTPTLTLQNAQLQDNGAAYDCLITTTCQSTTTTS